MTITMTGATGFLGQAAIKTLLSQGHTIRALGRRRSASLPAPVAFWPWDATSDPPPESLAGADAVIHLAGESVAQRWTPEAKARIRDSRVEGTRHLVQAFSAEPRPQVLVCASATGIYGSRGEEVLTESSSPGSDFLSRLAIQWENAAALAEPLGVRVVQLRFGLVLGRGGALAKMLPPFRFGAGGRLGSGRQWMSWVHIQDAVRLILFAIENAALRGPVNAVTPHPVTNAEFTRQLAAALHRPAIFPAPAFALKLLFGEMAELLLASQRVLPQVVQTAGFHFDYPELGRALAGILTAH